MKVSATNRVTTENQNTENNLALGTFDELLVVFSTKVNLLYLYSPAQKCCVFCIC